MSELLRRRVNGVNDDTVKAATGRNWSQWGLLLDKAGARMMDHAELVSCLRERFRLTPWWSRKVSGGYEQERGVRKKLQSGCGYTVTRSKTMPVPLAAVWRAWNYKRTRARWLPELEFVAGASKPRKVLRLCCPDESRICARFVERNGKTTVAVRHERLPTLADAERFQDYWSGALDRLRDILRP